MEQTEKAVREAAEMAVDVLGAFDESVATRKAGSTIIALLAAEAGVEEDHLLEVMVEVITDRESKRGSMVNRLRRALQQADAAIRSYELSLEMDKMVDHDGFSGPSHDQVLQDRLVAIAAENNMTINILMSIIEEVK